MAVNAAPFHVKDWLARAASWPTRWRSRRRRRASAREFLDLELDRYRLGIDPYVNVLTAQTTLLTAQHALVNLRTSRMTAVGQLIAALGGGSDRAKLPAGDH